MIANRSVLDWPTGTTVFKPEKCYNGYTVVTPYRSNLVFLIDMMGRQVHTWRADPQKNAESWFMRRLPNGNWLTLNYVILPGTRASLLDLFPTCFSTVDYGTEVVELDWEGQVVWRYSAPSQKRINHDMARLANGNTLILMADPLTAPSISEGSISDNYFIEVDPSGKVVWEWRTSEHFEELGFSEEARRLMTGKGRDSTHTNAISPLPAKTFEEAKRLMAQKGQDLFHTNTVSPLPGNTLEKKDSRFAKGNILTSQRETNLIYIIDKKTGKVVWTWGTEPGQLVGQHHPVMLHNGNILIYDNGGEAGYPPRVRFYTRLVEVDPIAGKIVWQYAYEPYTFKPTSRFFSSTWGSVQRLPNGNTFSLDCHKGRLFEVTPSGEIVWEYISPFAWGRGTRVLDSGIYRAYRYGYDDVPEADHTFKDTDGHVGMQPVTQTLPPYLGWPPTDLP